MQRVSGSFDTSNGELEDRLNNRFGQLCRAARQRGITIWVVSFGVGSDGNLNSCASSGQAFEADNAAELNEQFQAIARQISKRSEEHTSELQSLMRTSYAVFCLKKKKEQTPVRGKIEITQHRMHENKSKTI